MKDSENQESFWDKNVKEKLKEYKEMRSKHYFFISDGGNYDRKKRKELESYFIYIIAVLLIFCSIFPKIVGNFYLNIIFIVILLIFNNVSKRIAYYLVPLFSIIIALSFKFNIDISTNYLIISSILYLICTFSIPIYELRKINGFITLLSTLISSTIIPILKKMIINSSDIKVYEEKIKNLFFTDRVIKEFLEKNSNIKEIFDKIIFDYVDYIWSKEVDKIIFILITSYIIGILIYKFKIYIADLKAEDSYGKILLFNRKEMGESEYRELKNCIFYGGKHYKDILLFDRNIKNLVDEFEQEYINDKKVKISKSEKIKKIIEEKLKQMI